MRHNLCFTDTSFSSLIKSSFLRALKLHVVKGFIYSVFSRHLECFLKVCCTPKKIQIKYNYDKAQEKSPFSITLKILDIFNICQISQKKVQQKFDVFLSSTTDSLQLTLEIMRDFKIEKLLKPHLFSTPTVISLKFPHFTPAFRNHI